MRTEFMLYCFKSLKRRPKDLLRTVTAIFLSFTFVAGVMLFQGNMYEWQLQSVKNRFGNWFVMYYGMSNNENAALSSHPYLDESGKADVVNYHYDDNWQQTDMKIGYMNTSFVKLGNITPDKGTFPVNDDEIAVEWNTLLALNQGTEIGQDITIRTMVNNSKVSGGYERVSKTYKLAGILKSYTNVWVGGNNVPAIIVTKNEADRIKRSNSAVYIYSEGDYIEGDYRDIYEGIKKKAGQTLVYNSSVYDYEPWGGSNVYTYMYVILFISGIAGIAYQLSVYNRKRLPVYKIIRGIGAARYQLLCMICIENIVIVISSCVTGLIFSIIIGRLICFAIEGVTGIKFFTLDTGIYGGLIIMLIAAVIAGCVISVGSQIFTGRKKTCRCVIKPVHILNRKNCINQTYIRLMHSQGIVSFIAIRIFSLVMMIIMVVCVMNSVRAYGEYRDNSEKTDIIAFECNDNYALMYKGIDDSIIEYIRNITGVKDISYGYFDTARVWSWEGIDYNYIGIEEYMDIQNNNAITIDSGRYLFATEYAEPDSGIYDVLSEYLGEDSINYEAFKKGDESVIFIDKNMAGEYDKTIIAGSDIGIMCYKSYTAGISTSPDNAVSYPNSYYKAVYQYISDNNITDSAQNNSSNIDEISSDIELIQSEIYEKLKAGIDELNGESDELYSNRLYTYIKENDIQKQSELAADNKALTYNYYQEYVPAAVTKAAAVIYVDDDIKEQLKEYIPEFGVYTMLASDELGSKAVSAQNELLKDYLMVDELPDDITLAMKYNQINVRYGLNSVYNGTVNAVASYLRQAGFIYNSYSEEKDIVKGKTVEALILYGFTLVVSLTVYMVVLVIVLRNRMAEYKERMCILRSTGADRDVIYRLYMYGCIRELLWCIILMPVMLLIDNICIRRGIRGI